MTSVAIVCRKDKINKKGEVPIHYRLIKDRKISYLASGTMIPLENWDFEKNKLKAKHPNSVRINNELLTRLLEMQGEVISTETITKSLTTKQLRGR